MNAFILCYVWMFELVCVCVVLFRGNGHIGLQHGNCSIGVVMSCYSGILIGIDYFKLIGVRNRVHKFETYLIIS